jgi:hypothetical protein
MIDSISSSSPRVKHRQIKRILSACTMETSSTSSRPMLLLACSTVLLSNATIAEIVSVSKGEDADDRGSPSSPSRTDALKWPSSFISRSICSKEVSSDEFTVSAPLARVPASFDGASHSSQLLHPELHELTCSSVDDLTGHNTQIGLGIEAPHETCL